MQTRLIPAVFFCICILLLLAVPSRACYSIVVGRQASSDGCVIMAHNEDDYPPQIVHHRKILRMHHAPGKKVQLRNGGQLDQVEWTWAYLWSEMPGMLFSDSYVNEWGVCVTSDNCPSREDKPEITDGGIGYMLRRLVAERAKTAREGVLLAGSLVERFGYIASGRTYVISDPEEGWLFCAVQGKRWLARRVADNEVAMVANTYTVRQVDLSDKANVLASKDIVSYAIARGWYDPQTDGAFDFAAVYANPKVAINPSNLGRQWQGLEYLAPDPIRYDANLPFSVIPKNKVSVKDLFRILRHARETNVTSSDSLAVCPPEGSCLICSDVTQTSFVVQLRKQQPLDIGIVYWACLAPPETSIFIPFYFGISAFPDGYATDLAQPSRNFYDGKVASLFQINVLETFWTFSNFRYKMQQMGDDARESFMKKAIAIESSAVRLQKPFDDMALRLYKEDKAAVEQLLTNFSRGFYMSSLEAMNKVMKEQSSEQEIEVKAKAIHQAALTLDSHVDIAKEVYATAELDPGIDNPKLRCDLVKMDKGGIDGVFLAVFVAQSPELNEKGYAQARQTAQGKFEAIERLTKTMYPDRCGLAKSPQEVEKIVASGKKAIIIGMENGFPLGEDLDMLDHYYDMGARYVTLCHVSHNQICDSSSIEKPSHNGLSEFGKRVVLRMNSLGMMCDASHISEKSFFDLLKASKAPILVSHSGCSDVYPHDRNLTDQQLKALRENGGVIQIVALDSYLRPETKERKEALDKLRNELGVPSWQERRKMSDAELEALKPKTEKYYPLYKQVAKEFPIATIHDFVDHLDHAVKIAGIDHVGIGTDFDGGGGVPGFDNHAEALNVTKELVRRGYSDEDIRKIWGANLMRVWREVEDIARTSSP